MVLLGVEATNQLKRELSNPGWINKGEPLFNIYQSQTFIHSQYNPRDYWTYCTVMRIFILKNSSHLL